MFDCFQNINSLSSLLQITANNTLGKYAVTVSGLQIRPYLTFARAVSSTTAISCSTASSTKSEVFPSGLYSAKSRRITFHMSTITSF